MNLWDFLKYIDKYNRFIIYTKDEEISFSHNGNYWLTEERCTNEYCDTNNFKNINIADWRVLSYKINDIGEIEVFIAPDNQLMQNYNHFPNTKEEKLNYNKE
ncbi:hypothetical protein [Spiroplasma endosymbiont of Tricholauxania praeusta]|uniref:hypothetical protein n=1 Tax=Spiroplasma endosymbiont of Tricholauxania praeusta TaxID=3066296 RepID=UPI0030D5D81C